MRKNNKIPRLAKDDIGKYESCTFFLRDILELDEKDNILHGYGCMLGGGHLSKQKFFLGCENYEGMTQLDEKETVFVIEKLQVLRRDHCLAIKKIDELVEHLKENKVKQIN